MSRPFRFVLTGVMYIIAYVIHFISAKIFATDGALYTLASSGTEAMNGAQRAAFWQEALVVWVPLIAGVGITFWLLVSEYKAQQQTTAAARRRV